MIVLIDDERSFINDVDDSVVIRNSREALDWLRKFASPFNKNSEKIDQLWLDHDLGVVNEQKDTIIPFVRKLEELCFFGNHPEIGEVIVHTSNSIGGDEIVASLKNYYNVKRVFAGDYLTVK